MRFSSTAGSTPIRIALLTLAADPERSAQASVVADTVRRSRRPGASTSAPGQ